MSKIINSSIILKSISVIVCHLQLVLSTIQVVISSLVSFVVGGVAKGGGGGGELFEKLFSQNVEIQVENCLGGGGRTVISW